MWSIKSKGTTSRNEVKTNARGTILPDTDKNEDAGGIFIIKLTTTFCVMVWAAIKREVASKFVTDELKSRFEAENYEQHR